MSDVIDQVALRIDSGFLGGDVRTESPVVHEMPHVYALHQHEVIGDEAAVATPPDALRAHDGE
jgi:hypothetical protein